MLWDGGREGGRQGLEAIHEEDIQNTRQAANKDAPAPLTGAGSLQQFPGGEKAQAGSPGLPTSTSTHPATFGTD